MLGILKNSDAKFLVYIIHVEKRLRCNKNIILYLMCSYLYFVFVFDKIYLYTKFNKYLYLIL